MTRQLEGLLTTLAKCARRRGLLVALLVVIATMNAIAQDTPAPYMNEQGDTIAVSFPPEPGTYDPHQIIVKFARGVLNPSVLCFTIPLAIDSVEQHECQLQGIPSSFKSTLMNQLFHIDSGIILDANLRGAMYAAGGRYLRRMVSANPCSDTFTVARDGDTLPADDFNWMVLIMADGANPVTAVTALRDTSHMERVEMADLDMYGM